MRNLFAALIVIAAVGVVQASQPGQPMDCSDFVIRRARDYVPEDRRLRSAPARLGSRLPLCDGVPRRDAHDGVRRSYSAGQLLGADASLTQVMCNGYPGLYPAVRIKGLDGSSERLIAHASSRCAEVSDTPLVDELLLRYVTYDSVGGRLLVVFISSGNGGTAIYPSHLWWRHSMALRHSSMCSTPMCRPPTPSASESRIDRTPSAPPTASTPTGARSRGRWTSRKPTRCNAPIPTTNRSWRVPDVP